MDTIKADEVIEKTLQRGNEHLSGVLKSDVLILMSPMMFGVDDAVRDEVELLTEHRSEEEQIPTKLAVILETAGGYIEIVERIVAVFRRHYHEVEFIIPNYAYSAGTVLALSGDEIYMDYYSVLGPIDPQFQTDGGDSVPGLGYIAKYNELLDRINSVGPDEESKIRGELAFLLKKFDPAKLFHIEQAIKHSRDLIADWLPKYKFKNWAKTESSNNSVTPTMREERAMRIADKLADAEHWHSHGRGISMRELASDAIGLKVRDFGEDVNLNQSIRHYYGLFSDYVPKIGSSSAIHTRSYPHKGLT